MAATKRGPRRPYTPEEVSRTLLAIAMNRGVITDAHKALKILKEDGEIDRVPSITTIQNWRRDHAEEYARIAAEVMPAIRQVIAQENVELIQRYAGIEHRVLDKIEEQLDKAGKIDEETGERAPDVNVKDLTGLQRNMTVGRGISTDKYRDVTGEKFVPTGETRDPTEIMQSLQKQFPGAFVLLPPAQPPEAQPAAGSSRPPAPLQLPPGDAETVENVGDSAIADA